MTEHLLLILHVVFPVILSKSAFQQQFRAAHSDSSTSPSLLSPADVFQSPIATIQNHIRFNAHLFWLHNVNNKKTFYKILWEMEE